MLTVEVVSRADLSRVIERRLIDNPPATLMDLMREECPAFSEDVTPYLSAFVDAVRFPYDTWAHVDIKRAKTVKIVIEAAKKLDKVFIVPTICDYYRKEKQPFFTFDQKCTIITQMISTAPGDISIDTVEKDKDSKWRTINTAEYFKKKFPNKCK